VDGDVGGGNERGVAVPTGFLFDIAVTCDTAPTVAPSPEPSLSYAPTPVPTTVPARGNCVCMSKGMLAGIAEFCPLLRCARMIARTLFL